MECNSNFITATMLRKISYFWLIIGLINSPLLFSAEHAENNRPKIGLVLSGGGARGAAHIGILQVLEEQNVPIDYIVGTSMGAIVGGLYASGYSVAEIQQAINETDWVDMLVDRYDRSDYSFRRKREDFEHLVNASPGFSDRGEIKLPTGLIQGQKLTQALKRLTATAEHIHNFDHLPIPYRAIATDLVTGSAVVIQEGSLAMAMRASMSIPGGIAPVEKGEMLLVDGGVSNNLPIDVARSLGADIIIAVDISTPLTDRDKLTSIISITDQLTSILTRRNTEEQLKTLKKTDILILPELGLITTFDFNKANEAIDLGYAAARSLRSKLALHQLPKSDYLVYQKNRIKPMNESPVIHFITIDNQSAIADELIASRISTPLNEPLDLAQLEADIESIYSLDIFQLVTYDVIEKSSETGLHIYAKEKSWGPNYLQFGISLEDNFAGDANYNLGMSYKRTQINSLNGELLTDIIIGEDPKISVDWYQPLDRQSRYFIAPSLSYQVQNIPLFFEEFELAKYRIKKRSAALHFGRELGMWGEFRFGVERARGRINLIVGDPDLPNFKFDSGNWFAQFTYDKLDNVNFPRQGEYAQLQWTSGEIFLGADNEFDQVSASGLIARSWNKNTLIASLKMDSTVSGDAPIQERFVLGGFQNLSGYRREALSGQHRGFFALRYTRKISDIQLLPAYLGASLEYGQVSEERDEFLLDEGVLAGSIFLGLDTFLGPFYLGYGLAEGGEDTFYLYLGRLF